MNNYEGYSCLVCGRPTTHWIDGKPFCKKHNQKIEREKIGRYSGKQGKRRDDVEVELF